MDDQTKIDEPGDKQVTQALASLFNRMADVWSWLKHSVWPWLKHASKGIGFPAFLVALINLAVALTGLWYVVANYHLQIKSDRPNLAAAGAEINFNVTPPQLNIGWNNVGRQIARRGTARLLASNDDGKSWE